MRTSRLFGASLILLTYAERMFASEATHGINWWHLGAAYKDSPALGWLTMTFVIFVYGVCRVIKTPLSLYLETRSKDIRRQIEEGRLAKIESEKKLKLYDEKLRSLGQEIEKMKENFTEQAHAEKLERERQAREMEVRIIRDTEDTIRANIERTKNRLAEEAIVQALHLAERTIAQQQRDQVHEFLKGNFVTDLARTASVAKRGSVANEYENASLNNDLGTTAREVH